MNKFTQKPGTFTLFLNKAKKADNHPDYKLTACLPDGNTYEFAAWFNPSDTGGRITGTITKVEAAQHQSPRGSQPLPIDDVF